MDLRSMLSESEQFIHDYPTLDLADARSILADHGYDDADIGWRDDLGVSFDPEGYEHVLYLREDGDIDTQELFNWLGY